MLPALLKPAEKRALDLLYNSPWITAKFEAAEFACSVSVILALPMESRMSFRHPTTPLRGFAARESLISSSVIGWPILNCELLPERSKYKEESANPGPIPRAFGP